MTIEPTLLADLGDYEPISWYWEGFVAPKRKTIFVGHPKAGKTTLISHLVKGLSGASTSIGPPCLPCKTLILTEEHLDLWKRRRDDLGIIGTQVWVQRIKRATDYALWEKQISNAEDFMLANDITTLIIDTLSSLWPCLDENDAAGVGRALDPINKLADRGMAVVCVHHAPKAKQSAVISARGSTAITAFFDIVINMRTSGKGSHTTRRSLKSWGRDLETPETLLLDYRGPDGYVAYEPDEETADPRLAALGMHVQATRQCNKTNMIALLIPTLGQTRTDLRESLSISEPVFKDISKDLIDEGKMTCTGAGIKGSPYLYFGVEKCVSTLPSKVRDLRNESSVPL